MFVVCRLGLKQYFHFDNLTCLVLVSAWPLPIGCESEMRNRRVYVIRFWCRGDEFVGGNPSLAGVGACGAYPSLCRCKWCFSSNCVCILICMELYHEVAKKKKNVPAPNYAFWSHRIYEMNINDNVIILEKEVDGTKGGGHEFPWFKCACLV